MIRCSRSDTGHRLTTLSLTVKTVWYVTDTTDRESRRYLTQTKSHDKLSGKGDEEPKYTRLRPTIDEILTEIALQWKLLAQNKKLHIFAMIKENMGVQDNRSKSW